MKIAISTIGETLDSEIDPRFGRCTYFIIADTETKTLVMSIKNEGTKQAHGAGICAAQQVSDAGAEAIITGELGPKAADTLQKLGIKGYHASGKATDAVDAFNQGTLELMGSKPQETVPLQTEGMDDERIYFPLLEDKGLDSPISHHFGHAPVFGIYETKTKSFRVIDNSLDHHDPSQSPVDQIIERADPTIIFAHGIGARAISLFSEKGVPVKTGSFDTVKEVIDNLDTLRNLSESCGHNHHH